MIRSLATLGLLSCLFISNANALEGLIVSELPIGGDITVPPEYPVMVPAKIDVVFSGVTNPQTISLLNGNASVQSVIKIYAQFEKTPRTVTLKPGTTAIYSFKNSKPIRLRVAGADVKISSLQALKVQR